jgi:hypothetical protein
MGPVIERIQLSFHSTCLSKIVLGDLRVAVTLSALALGACSSQAIKPEAKNISVTREAVSEKCISLGLVEGRTISIKGTFEDALENLKLDAARKGATHVKIEATSAMGSAVRGEAYQCP